MFVWYVRGTPRTYEGPPASRVTPVSRSAPTGAVTPHDRDDESKSSAALGKPLRAYGSLTQGEDLARRQILYVKEIMSTPVKSVGPDDTLESISRIFATKKFRHVPVCDDSGKVIGIASERDLLRKMLAQPADPFSSVSPVTVSAFMKTSVLTASPHAQVRAAARIMYDEKVGALPVLDDQGNLVGIVTRSDILRTLMNTVPLELWS
jgi:acetoin utilization protein AcuB